MYKYTSVEVASKQIFFPEKVISREGDFLSQVYKDHVITDVVEFLPNLVITGIFYLFVYLLHIVPPAFLAIGIFYSY